jgi:hypothetical protein
MLAAADATLLGLQSLDGQLDHLLDQCGFARFGRLSVQFRFHHQLLLIIKN